MNKNFQRLQMHNVASMLVMAMPCVEMIRWIINNVDVEIETMISDEGICVTCFKVSILDTTITSLELNNI